MWVWYLDTLCVYWPDIWSGSVCGSGTWTLCVYIGLILGQIVYVGLVL
jgi:hypothetical protein